MGRRSKARAAAAGAIAIAAMAPRGAAADEPRKWEYYLNPGVLWSYGLGDASGTALGAEVSLHVWPGGFNDHTQHFGFGPLLQVQEYLADDQRSTRVAAGLEGSFYAFLGLETAYAYRSAAGPYAATHGLQIAPYMSFGVLVGSLRMTIPLSASGQAYPFEFAPTVALKIPLPIGEHEDPDLGMGSPGRPLRAEGALVRARTRGGDRAGWSSRARPRVRGLSADTRAALAAAWIADGRAEHASVAAFGQLAIELLAVGAPASLVAACHRAALQEVVHAREAFALASGYAGRAVEPDAMPQARALRTRADVEELLVESFADGCVAEGAAAAGARLAMRRAADPAVRRVLARVARDEASHARLAWRIVRWCVEALGAARARPLVDVPEIGHAPRPAPGATAKHGRLSPEEERWLLARTRAAARARFEALTAPRPRARRSTTASRSGGPAPRRSR